MFLHLNRVPTVVVCATKYELGGQKDTARQAARIATGMSNCLPDLRLWIIVSTEAEPRTLRFLGMPHHRSCLIRLL